jgi:hypothetical protein
MLVTLSVNVGSCDGLGSTADEHGLVLKKQHAHRQRRGLSGGSRPARGNEGHHVRIVDDQ